MEKIITEPNEQTEMKCPTCGTFMDVWHSPGVASMGAAMCGLSTPHDVWTCPNQYEEWHEQASALKEEIEKTASKTLADLLSVELEKILATRDATQVKD